MGRAGVAVSAADVERCATGLEAVVENLFAGLRSLAADLEATWRAGSAPLRPDDISEFQPAIFHQLDTHPAYDSAGFIMNPAAIEGDQRLLEWWRRADDGRHEQVLFNLEPGTPDCYDYFAMAWFAAGMEGRRFAEGPKIDLPCADVYVTTCTQPAVVDDVVLGVTATDVALSRFEAETLPPLRRLEAPAVLVNGQRRIITSNDAAWIGGEKLPAQPEPGTSDWQAVIPVTPDLGWTLAIHR